jgi:MFS family permease
VIAREADDRKHDQHFALLTAGVSVGQLVGPLAGGLLLGQRADLTATSHVLLVAAGVAAVAAVFATLGCGGSSPPIQYGAPARVHEILRTPGVAVAIFASVAALAATDVFTAYLPVLGEQQGIAPAAIGVLLALRAGASLISRIGITHVVARVGRSRLIALTAVAAAVAFDGVTLTHDLALLVVLVVAMGAALGFAQPLSMTVVVQLVPLHARSSALAVRLTGNRLGQVAAPAAAGLVAGSAGASSVFWMTSGVLVASAIAVQRLERPQPVAQKVERGGDEDRDRLGGTLAEPGLDQ